MSLSLNQARTIIDGALKKARALGLNGAESLLPGLHERSGLLSGTTRRCQLTERLSDRVPDRTIRSDPDSLEQREAQGASSLIGTAAWSGDI